VQEDPRHRNGKTGRQLLELGVRVRCEIHDADRPLSVNGRDVVRRKNVDDVKLSPRRHRNFGRIGENLLRQREKIDSSEYDMVRIGLSARDVVHESSGLAGTRCPSRQLRSVQWVPISPGRPCRARACVR
jgi:hypothetical protein